MAHSTWTAAADKQLEDFVLDGVNPAEIARRMRRSYTATYNRVLRFNARRFASGDEPVSEEDMRPCLKCGQDFKSKWKGNRICTRCETSNKVFADVGAW